MLAQHLLLIGVQQSVIKEGNKFVSSISRVKQIKLTDPE